MEITDKLLCKEIYTFNHDGYTITYAPLTRFFHVVLANSTNNVEWIENATKLSNVPAFVQEKWFSEMNNKLRIRLNVTSKCNLSCSYCSVSALKKWGKNMDKLMAFLAIDKLVSRAKELWINEIELTFSWWEPTIRAHTIKEIIEYTETLLESNNIILTTKLLTNGILSDNFVDDYSYLFNWIQVSWDWDLNWNPRYWEYVKKKSLIVRNNIKRFIEQWVKINIATVISKNNYQNIWYIIDDIYNTLNIEDIFLWLQDSLWLVSDSVTHGINYEDLRKNYINMWKKYREKDIDIPLTWTDIHSISNAPCWISAPNYSISPDWDISSCTVSFNDNNDHSKLYSIWKITKDNVIFDENKIKEFQKIKVLDLLDCESCFAKWHCRWWCRYANNEKWLWNINPDRCDMIRNIVADKILFFAWIKD